MCYSLTVWIGGGGWGGYKCQFSVKTSVICQLYMFFPLITRPSRITSHSATLIDNIFANNFFELSRSGLLFSDISDHLPVFSIHSDNVNKSVNRCRQDPFFIRDKNPNNIPTFVEKLEVVDWSSIKTCDEPDIAYKRFHEMYTKIYNDYFPLKKATRKRRSL